MYEDVSYLLRSPLRLKIIECLSSSDKSLTPLDIAKKTDIARSNVSTKLGELVKKNYVTCVNPKDRKWRFYQISNKGKKALSETIKYQK